LRIRWIALGLIVTTLLVLSPTAVPSRAVDPILSAKLALRTGRWSAARAAVEAALEFEPALRPLHAQAAQLALLTSDLPGALAHLQALPQKAPVISAASCLQIEMLLHESEVLEALTAWSTLSGACPLQRQLLNHTLEVTLSQPEAQFALQALEMLRGLDAQDEEVAQAFALAHATVEPATSLPLLRDLLKRDTAPLPLTRDLIQAIEAASLEDDQAYTLAQTGVIFAQAGEWWYALWAFDGAIALQPDYAHALAYAGFARERVGLDGGALLAHAVELEPQAVLPRILLATVLLEDHLPAQAQAELEIAAGLDPQDPAIAAQLASAYAAQGDILAAAQAHAVSTSRAPDQAEFWLLRARFALNRELEVGSLAIPAARNAVTLSRGEPDALDALAYAHYLLDNLVLAERLLWRSIAADPRQAESQFHLGLLLQRQERFEMARAAYELALALAPEGPMAARTQRALELLPR
jgi:tetratricopeptide (TPR) repeat protein